MKKAIEVKEKIIEVTIELIQKSNGNASEITTRDIAQKAEVGNGLINYHFQTKENLIAICVQRMIGKAVDNFQPNLSKCQSVEERITCAATSVFEFLFANPAISRISILGDFHCPDENSNTVKSQRSISCLLGESMDELNKQIFSFALVSAMQAAFLASQLVDNMPGFKLDTTASRGDFMKKLVSMLFHEIKVGEEHAERRDEGNENIHEKGMV